MRRLLMIGSVLLFLVVLGIGLGVYFYTRSTIPVFADQPRGEDEQDKPGAESKEFKNSIDMRLARIPAGTFQMGSPDEEYYRSADETRHEVAVTKPFFMGVHEVTQGQYEKIMGVNPSFFAKTGGGKERVKDKDTANYPVERVAWIDAVEFCKKLGAKENKTYRLPTEAEWEYACRAGTKTVFHTGNDFNSNLANINGLIYSSYGKEEAGPFYRSTVKVGDYKANPFGLYDMHGNVQEWCADWYADDYYKNSPKDDPQGPDKGAERVLRGGGWPSSAKSCRSAARNKLAPEDKTYTTGFRVVLEAK